MPRNFVASSEESPNTTPQLLTPPSKPWTLLQISRYFTIFWPVLFILASLNTAIRSAIVPPTTIPSPNLIISPSPSVEQNVQHQAALIRDNLPAYLNFVSTEVLPVMSKNIDEIVQNLQGLTDISPGLFYHGHIDYSVDVSGGIDGLMNMNNVVLQYHTLETPQVYIHYWRQELGNIHDQNINAWLARSNEYNRAISISSTAFGVQYTPLTNTEAVIIASNWDDYRKQNGLASPGVEMLTNMVYLIDGGKQPHYQAAFKTIYRFHSIAFDQAEYLQLDNRTHLENTFSPFQITFETISKCQELLPIFEEAGAANFGYILNPNNVLVAHAARVSSSPEWLQNPEMAQLGLRLNQAISTLPDDNLIKINSTSADQQIAFFIVGNYIFGVYGSLDSPSIFK
jgi:hypothetical protein